MTKKFLAALLALALMLGTIPAALASVGDVTIHHASSEDGLGYESVGFCMLVGNRVFYQAGSTLYIYDIAAKETEKYDAYSLIDEAESEQTLEDGDEPVETQHRETAAWFAYKDELYAVVNIGTYGENTRTLEGGYIYRLECADGTAQLVESDLPRLDWSAMIEDYGDYMYSRWPNSCFASGDSLYVQTYDDDGNQVLEVFSLTTGKSSEHYIQDLLTIAPAGEKVMALQYVWGEEQAHFGLYDPSDESMEFMADYPMDAESYITPRNICYRADNDTLYYVMAGEIWAAPGFDFANAQTVNDCPVDSNNGVTQMTEDGFLLLYDWQTILLRNTDPSQRAEITLYVKDYNYADTLDRAYYDYTNQHGDISMVISRNGSPDDILQAMMNRDGSVDIYAMDISISQYNAVFERGYMAELDSSAKLMEKIDSMYPAFGETVKKDGRLYALPIGAYGYTMGVNAEALKKLGWTMEDMPKTWDEFFDFLAELPAKLEDKQVRAFESWYDRSDLRANLFFTILGNYQSYLNAGETEYAFNTPMLRNLMQRLEEIDYEALDVPESTYDEETDTWYDDYDGRQALFSSSISTIIQSWYEGEPLMLTFGEEQPRLSVNLRVVFVNPFSAHVPECIEFLEVVADNLDKPTQYTFFPSCNEPVRYPDFDEYKENLAHWLEEAKKSRDEADEDEKVNWDEQIGYLEDELANIDDTYWMFSPKAIEAYQKRAQYLAPLTYDFTNEINSNGDSDFYDMVQRYYQGMIGADELLAAIDKKVQMMRLEGN